MATIPFPSRPDQRAEERRVVDEGGTGIPSGRRIFSELLLASSLINRHDLVIAVEYAEREMIPLVDAVVALGFVSEIDSYAALARATGLPLLDLADVAVSPLAIKLVPEKVARRHGILALREDNRTLTYAISRPFNDEAERDVSFASGRQARAVLMCRSQVMDAVEQHYPKLGQVEELLTRVKRDARVEQIDAIAPASVQASPVIQLCNQIIGDAVDARASDIHMEPSPAGLTVRFRLCGILEHILVVPREASGPVINRFKIMARTDIAICRRPQDGAFRAMVNDRAIDVRLSTLPTVHGEKIVMRIIDSQTEIRDLDRLGHDPATLARIKHALLRPDGLVIVTGPTGSGKTTVLYSALNHLRTGHSNIVSVEDPVERRVEGVNQIAVNARSGNSFAGVLRSLMRQDPNVIMVGEIRDGEVAQIVGQAADTGHLVLSSVHASDAASAITRLMNLGLEPFKVAECLAAIVGQRLIRRLCPDCRVATTASEAVQIEQRYGVAQVPFRPGPGCPRCRHTGYAERMPVAEVLVPDDELRSTIARGANAAQIRAAMRAGGQRLMRDVALGLVKSGHTSIDEVNRVLADDRAPAAVKGDRKRVLITDDDRIIRMLVRLLLEREGLDVLEAEDGNQAVMFAKREKPDLLIIDIMMPTMDGFEAIGHIRHDLSLANMPVMVLTAESGPGTQERVLELGADDYLVKPFEPAILLSRVRAMFRRMDRAAA